MLVDCDKLPASEEDADLLYKVAKAGAFALTITEENKEALGRLRDKGLVREFANAARVADRVFLAKAGETVLLHLYGHVPDEEQPADMSPFVR